MKVLALDPGNSTGYALVDVNEANNTADIYEYGIIEPDTSSEYMGDHCISLMNKISDIIKKESVDKVCVEDYFFSQRFANGCNVNAAYRTCIHIRCRELGVPYEILNISLWKKYVAGRSTPTKEQKRIWGKGPAKKLYIQQALWDRYRIRFPNFSMSLKTSKPILFKSDPVDAVAQSIFFVEIFLHVKTMTCSVSIPSDVKFKRHSKKMFVYN